MKFFARFAARSVGGIRVVGAVAGLATPASVWGSAAVADPAEDALAEFTLVCSPSAVCEPIRFLITPAAALLTS